MYHALVKHFRLLILWGVILAIVVSIIGLFLPRQYSATSQAMIISRDRTGVDPYTQVKSAERIGEDLVQVMKTTDFFSKTMESTATGLNKDSFTSLADREQRKKWQKDVQAAVVSGTSLLNLTVYAHTPEEAVALSNAVTETLVGRGWEYVGGDVVVKSVNRALVSRLPARPNFILNAVLAFVAGVILAVFWVLKYRRSIFSR